MAKAYNIYFISSYYNPIMDDSSRREAFSEFTLIVPIHIYCYRYISVIRKFAYCATYQTIYSQFILEQTQMVCRIIYRFYCMDCYLFLFYGLVCENCRRYVLHSE